MVQWVGIDLTETDEDKKASKKTHRSSKCDCWLECSDRWDSHWGSRVIFFYYFCQIMKNIYSASS